MCARRRGVEVYSRRCGRMVERYSFARIESVSKVVSKLPRHFLKCFCKRGSGSNSVEALSSRSSSQIVIGRRGVEVYSRRCGRMVGRIVVEQEHRERSFRLSSQISHPRRGVEVYSRRCGRMVSRAFIMVMGACMRIYRASHS